MGRARRRAVALVAVVVAIVAAVVVVRIVSGPSSDFAKAMSVVPADTMRLSFTDWAAVRERLGGSDDLAELMEAAYDADLSAASSIDESAVALEEHFGFSPASIEWEAFAQSTQGAAMVVRLADDTDPDDVRDQLDDLGYTEPDDADGVWLGGIDLVAGIDPTITPELQYVAVLADEHLVVTSDTVEYAAAAAEVARGDAKSLADVQQDAGELADSVGDPAAAVMWADDFACEDLSMASAGADARTEAERLIDDAGGLDPLTGLVFALGPDRRLTVSELFEDDDQANRNLKPRADLAVGAAVGRGGAFADIARLTGSHRDGRLVVLDFDPAQPDNGFVLSALDSGPVLFASC